MKTEMSTNSGKLNVSNKIDGGKKKKKKAWEIAYFSMKAAIGFFFFQTQVGCPPESLVV